MKDIKIQPIRTVTENLSPQQTGKKEKVAGQSFDETLHTSIERMNDLKSQADAAINVKETEAAAIKEEITNAKEIFDKLMAEKKNLSQLYHRIKTQDEA